MRHVLLILLVLLSACADLASTFSTKKLCGLEYNSNGVILSQIKPDYTKTYTGGKVRINVEVTNTGEQEAKNLEVMCTDDSELSCPDPRVFFTKQALKPPDKTACIEGDVAQKQVTVEAKTPTGEEPAYFKVRLSYDYSSLSWSDVTVVSEAQWKIRTQQGVKPVQSTYQSAAPVKIELTVPDAPVVYEPGAKFPVTVILKNAFEGYGYPQVTRGLAASLGVDYFKNNKVDSVVLTAPEGLVFVKDCKEITGTTTESKTCTIEKAEITKEDDSPKSYVATMQIKTFKGEEESYKIKAVANYRYVVKEASANGVEIKAV